MNYMCMELKGFGFIIIPKISRFWSICTLTLGIILRYLQSFEAFKPLYRSYNNYYTNSFPSGKQSRATASSIHTYITVPSM